MKQPRSVSHAILVVTAARPDSRGVPASRRRVRRNKPHALAWSSPKLAEQQRAEAGSRPNGVVAQSPAVKAFTGARVVDGTTAAPIDNATIVVRDGKIVARSDRRRA